MKTLIFTILVTSRLRSLVIVKIAINSGKKLFYEKNYAKIGVNTDDDIPLNKQLKF